MINAEDLRIGDIVQTNKDCTFPKGTSSLIDRISGKGTWASNPYVFVYDFELKD